jgi:hypothetical protein
VALHESEAHVQRKALEWLTLSDATYGVQQVVVIKIGCTVKGGDGIPEPCRHSVMNAVVGTITLSKLLNLGITEKTTGQLLVAFLACSFTSQCRASITHSLCQLDLPATSLSICFLSARISRELFIDVDGFSGIKQIKLLCESLMRVLFTGPTAVSRINRPAALHSARAGERGNSFLFCLTCQCDYSTNYGRSPLSR